MRSSAPSEIEGVPMLTRPEPGLLAKSQVDLVYDAYFDLQPSEYRVPEKPFQYIGNGVIP
jgi:hypothetical protein